MGTRECFGCLDIDNFFSQAVWREKGAEGWKGALEFHTGKILSAELLLVPLISSSHQSHSFHPEDSQEVDAVVGKWEGKVNKELAKWHILGR